MNRVNQATCNHRGRKGPSRTISAGCATESRDEAGCGMGNPKKTREEFFASILDDDTERELCKKSLNSRIAWKTFRLVAAYKHVRRRQREHLSTILGDENEMELWKHFLQSESTGIAREAARLAKRCGLRDSEKRFRW
jgi:hypothetical protein